MAMFGSHHDNQKPIRLSDPVFVTTPTFDHSRSNDSPLLLPQPTFDHSPKNDSDLLLPQPMFDRPNDHDDEKTDDDESTPLPNNSGKIAVMTEVRTMAPQSPQLHAEEGQFIDPLGLDTGTSLYDDFISPPSLPSEDFSSMNLLDDLLARPSIQTLYSTPVAHHIHAYQTFLPAESLTHVPPPSGPVPVFSSRPTIHSPPSVLPKKRPRTPSARKSTKGTHRQLFDTNPLDRTKSHIVPPLQTPENPPRVLTGGLAPLKPKEEFKWIQCVFCFKWRKIPAHISEHELPPEFSCIDNRWDNHYNSCGMPQEEYATNDGIDENPFQHEEYIPYTPAYESMESQADYQPPRKRKKRGRKKIIRTTHQRYDTSRVALTQYLQDNRYGPEYTKKRADFYYELEQFLGYPPPLNSLSGQPLDLYRLYYECQDLGGYGVVCQQKQWRSIYRKLPNYQETHTSASYAIKKVYTKNLLAYERHHNP